MTITDSETFAPVVVRDARATEWTDVRVEFTDWAWLAARIRAPIGGCYAGPTRLDGYGIEAIVKASRILAGLAVYAAGVHYASEGNSLCVHFASYDEAVETALRLQTTLSSEPQVYALADFARANGLDTTSRGERYPVIADCQQSR